MIKERDPGLGSEDSGPKKSTVPSSDPKQRLPSQPPSLAPSAPRGVFGPAARRSSIPQRPDAMRGLQGAWASPVAQLSPRMTAVFGGLFGLATIASVFALLIRAAPPEELRVEMELQAASEQAAAEGEAEAEAVEAESAKPKRVKLPGPWRIEEWKNDPDVRIVSGKIERRAFVTALQEEGVPKKQVYRVLKAFEGLRNFDKTNRKDEFVVALDRSTKEIKAFEYIESPLDIFQAKAGADGLLAAEKLDMKIADNEVVASFYVTDDLKASYERAGLEPGILDAINTAFNGRISTESFEPGGTVRIIVTEVTALGLFAEYKRIEAVEYRPADPDEDPYRAYYFAGEEAKGYFDERGRQPFEGGWRLPVPGAPMTSPFNPKRLHPILKTVRPHNGTDFGAPTGTPVYSAYRGTVEFVGYAGAAGNLVRVTHPNGVTTGYAHLSRFADGIKVGDKIGVHELVGYVGSTGRSTGPHLHFSAKRDGKFFDAMTLKMDGVRVMPGADRPSFVAHKAALDLRIDAIPLAEAPPAPKKEEPKEEPKDDAKPAEDEPKKDEPKETADSSGAKPPEDEPESDGGSDDDDEGGDSLLGADLGGL